MDQLLRFAMITTFYPPCNFGGDGIFVQHLANELARRGHKVEVVHCLDSYRLLAGRQSMKKGGDHANVTVHTLKSPFGFLSPLATHQTGSPFFKLARIQQILEKGFDVVHYHNISLAGGPKILQYGRGIKLYTMHEHWLTCPTHTLFRFNRAACVQRFCLACTLCYKRLPQWWRYSGLLEKMIEKVDVLISPSLFSKDLHQRLGFRVPLSICRISCLWRMTYRQLWKVPDSGTPPQEPYFLFVGRLEKLKGLQMLIPVFRRYSKARLLIAGAGSYEPRLRRLAAGSANIEFLGHLSQRGLKGLYRRAVALIVPSLWFDVFPLVILEAFREQTPVLLRNIGGLPEIVQQSRGGVVFDTEDDWCRLWIDS